MTDETDDYRSPGYPEYVEVRSTSPLSFGESIRKFADADIGGSIDRALAQVPQGHTIAVVAYADLKDRELRGAVMFRIGDEWSFVAPASVRLNNGRFDWEAGVAVRWSK